MIKRSCLYLQQLLKIQLQLRSCFLIIKKVSFLIKNQIRRMKLMQYLTQLRQTLFRIGTSKVLSKIFSILSYFNQFIEGSKVIPCRESFQYALAQLQRFAVLESRIIQKSKQTALCCMSLLSVGNFFAKNSLILGFIGDVFSKTKKCLKITTKAYETIRLIYIENYEYNAKAEIIPSLNFAEDLHVWMAAYELNHHYDEKSKNVMNAEIFQSDKDNQKYLSKLCLKKEYDFGEILERRT